MTVLLIQLAKELKSTRSPIPIVRVTLPLDLYLYHRHPGIHHQHTEWCFYSELPG